MNRGLVSGVQARSRIRDALTTHPDADVRLIAVVAELSLRRTTMLLEGLERSAIVTLYSPEPGVTNVRLNPEALKRKWT